MSLGRWSSRIPTGFLVSRGTWVPDKRGNPFAYRSITFCGDPSHGLRLGFPFVTLWPLCAKARRVPRPRRHNAHTLTCRRFGLFPVRSPLLGESRLISVPLGTEMVHFPRFASPPYGFRWRYPVFNEVGFPIRKSPDRSLLSDSPGLIAAGRVLRRLPAPRHPLHALSNLTIKFSQDKKQCR